MRIASHSAKSVEISCRVEKAAFDGFVDSILIEVLDVADAGFELFDFF